MAYAWIIDIDYLDDDHAAGTIGPRGVKDALVAELLAGKGSVFRLLDDDGELYYSGHIVGDFDGFEPLDDYGMPNAGCTTIQYRVNGRWKVL